MATSEGDMFSVSGPHFLTSVDWSNSYHRRSVAASLVQGAYLIEHDRQRKAEGHDAAAPPWWEFFNFKLDQLLIDDHDVSYFGAIFEYKYPYPHSGQGPPHYVVAFRGTIPEAGNRAEDFKLDLHVIFNDLQNSSRFHGGIEKAREIVYKAGQCNVWLAGHSLGSSIALLIGRDMAKTMGIHLETYLFNPPFISPPLGRIKNEKVQFGLRFASSVITAGIVAVTNTGHGKGDGGEADTFVVLSTWVPYLFLNPMDHICCEYIGYFKHREKMASVGAGRIGQLATQHSIGSIASGARGQDSDAIHLIPSAYLTINAGQSAGFLAAHALHQWWKHDLELNYNLYHYMPN